MKKKNIKKSRGFLKISSDVIASILKSVVTESEYAILDGKPLIILDSDKGTSKSIDSVTVKIKLRKSYDVKNICEGLQDKIKSSIQNMTGTAVSAVNIVVTDMIF